MLSQKSIKEFASRWHTSELNVLREYLQNLLLSHLYQQPLSDKVAFKGGTALRLLYGSPRFSEDLDFSSPIKVYHVKKILEETFQSVKKEAIPFSCLEAKPTSGGYFSIYQFELHGHSVEIEWNFSLRLPTRVEPILVTTPMVPHYQCMVLPLKVLVHEKMEALLRRKKPRDFYDLYFLLRERRGLESIIPLKKKLEKEILRLEPNALKRELKLLLPASHHTLLNSFSRMLVQELNRL